MLKITVISDTHNKHKKIDLPGGDLLIHAGDISSIGYEHEIKNFLNWFNEQSKQYTEGGVFIAGNHDFYFQNKDLKILNKYHYVEYLQDSELVLYFDGPSGDYSEDNIHIYGAPWQPEFMDWAFNLPRNGEELQKKWELIPENTDILITHGPPYGILDISTAKFATPGNLGCELLRKKISEIKPKIHIFGHIHSGYGYKFIDNTHFINASSLNEQYQLTNFPITFLWDSDKNFIKFI